jgi:hypothetical protein
MGALSDPLAPNPETNVDIIPLPDPPKQEDLTAPVPLGEPAGEGYVIEEEDPEYAPPEKPAP